MELPQLTVANPLGAIQQAQQLQGGQQEMALRNQQMQGQSLAIQQQQRQQDSEQALMDAYQKSGGDPDKALTLAKQSGKVLPQDIMNAQKGLLEMKNQTLDYVQKVGAKAVSDSALMQGIHDQVAAMPPEQRPQGWQQGLVAAQKAGIDISQVPQQYPGDQAFSQMGLSLKTHDQLVKEATTKLENAKTVADTNQANAKANESNAIAQKVPYDIQADQAKTSLTNKEAQNFGQVTPKDRFVQNQENLRASLSRQASMGNELQKQGIASLQKQSDTYGQFLGTANSLKNSLAAANNGNQLAAAVAPLQGTLFITTSEGVKRINETELQGVAGAGSLVQRIEGALGKTAGDGPLSPQLKSDMGKLVDLYTAAKYQAYQNQASYTKQLHGLAASTPVLQQDGSISGNPNAVQPGNGQTANAGSQPANKFSVTAPNGKTYSFGSAADLDVFKKRTGIK